MEDPPEHSCCHRDDFTWKVDDSRSCANRSLNGSHKLVEGRLSGPTASTMTSSCRIVSTQRFARSPT